MAHDVFISYSSEDRLTADAVCNALENAKIRCWIAPRDVVPGRDYGRDIIDALKASKIMVVVFSADCDRSEQVMNEVERAVNSRLIIIPFRIENVEPTGSSEFHLSRRHWLDALTPPLKKHLKKLCVAVQRNLPSPEVQGEPVRPGIETGREPGRPTPEPPSALVLPAAQVIPKPPFLSPEAPPESDSHTPEPQTESNTDPLPFRPKPESISSDEPPLGLRTFSEVKPEPVISQPTPHREPDVARSKIPGFVHLIAVLIALAVFYLVIAPPAYMRRLITIIWPDRNQELLQAAQQNEWQRVQDLLSRGASINGVKSDGTSVLMIAAAKGEREVVKLLLEGGADVNAKDGAGATALIMASGKGHLEVVKQLLSKGADVNAKDSRGSTALLLASRSGDLQTVKLLIDMGANVNARREDGSTPLMMAARNCQLEVVKLLLTKGADVHAKVNDGSTALLLAASSEDRTDATASTSCQEVLSLLLAKGADVNDASNSRGRTPLMAAVIQGHPEVVKLLLAKGANIDIKDKEGKTALTHASEQGHVEVANLVKEWDSAIRGDLRELKTLSKKYHEYYVASDKDEMMSFYDFPINYYKHGYQGKARIESEWDREFARWTNRDSEIKSIEVPSYSLAAGEATVHLTYSYRWTNHWGQEVTGTAVCFITCKKIKDKWEIKGLNEKPWADESHLTTSSWRRAVVTDSDGFACMRAGKGTEFECLVKVPDGEEILTEQSEEEWLRVKTADGQTGFMHYSRLRKIPE